VEKVSPDSLTASAASTETVIVRESELLSNAISKVSPSVVRLFTPGKDEAGNDAQLFIGLAIVADANGVLIADAGTPDGTLTALRSDGVTVPVNVLARPTGSNLIRLQAATTNEKNEKIDWRPIGFAKKDVALGASVVTIGGRTAVKIGKGVIIGTSAYGNDNPSGIIETDIPADSFAAGSPLIDADGAVIGIATRESRAAATGGFLASSAIVLQNNSTEGGAGAP
jgi:S1-C subfamily serine protease